MNDDAQILIARLLTHQTLRRDDKMVKRALSDEQFRIEVDKRLLECGMKLLDNVYADHVTHRAAPQCRAEDLRRARTSGRTIISA